MQESDFVKNIFSKKEVSKLIKFVKKTAREIDESVKEAQPSIKLIEVKGFWAACFPDETGVLLRTYAAAKEYALGACELNIIAFSTTEAGKEEVQVHESKDSINN